MVLVTSWKNGERTRDLTNMIGFSADAVRIDESLKKCRTRDDVEGKTGTADGHYWDRQEVFNAGWGRNTNNRLSSSGVMTGVYIFGEPLRAEIQEYVDRNFRG